MTEGTYDIVCQQGATFERLFAITRNAAILDLTDYTAKLQVRRTHETRAVLLELTSEVDGGLEINGALGRISLSLTPAQTQALPAVTAVYDLLLTSPAPESAVTRYLAGKFVVSAGVTRTA